MKVCYKNKVSFPCIQQVEKQFCSMHVAMMQKFPDMRKSFSVIAALRCIFFQAFHLFSIDATRFPEYTAIGLTEFHDLTDLIQ